MSNTSTNPEISLDEFIRMEQERLDKFKAYWIRESKVNDLEFPLFLLSGDWDEMYMIFDEND